ncbi:hypothetical protein PYCCODRAFT_1083971 [Trametes coccinea BRFM310]|uniref:Uncharacterized protein n=1 Tax=Trametes coccinea (strain BRFM310) TaxID=1353009 RepID=A0A1Y2IYG9_TRAC3|nr:hypothetical protein PYCCODRAFT_1083971 [Trametes coccinea BRFM310]
MSSPPGKRLTPMFSSSSSSIALSGNPALHTRWSGNAHPATSRATISGSPSEPSSDFRREPGQEQLLPHRGPVPSASHMSPATTIQSGARPSPRPFLRLPVIAPTCSHHARPCPSLRSLHIFPVIHLLVYILVGAAATILLFSLWHTSFGLNAAAIHLHWQVPSLLLWMQFTAFLMEVRLGSFHAASPQVI